MALRASDAGSRSGLLQLLARVAAGHAAHQVSHGTAAAACNAVKDGSAAWAVAPEHAPASGNAPQDQHQHQHQQQQQQHANRYAEPWPLLPANLAVNQGGCRLGLANHAWARHSSSLTRGRPRRRSGSSFQAQPETHSTQERRGRGLDSAGRSLLSNTDSASSQSPEEALLASLLGQGGDLARGASAAPAKRGLRGRRRVLEEEAEVWVADAEEPAAAAAKTGRREDAGVLQGSDDAAAAAQGGVQRAGAQQRWGSEDEAGEHNPLGLRTVSAEAAAQAATRCRSASMAHLPEALKQVLEGYLEGSGLRPAQLRSLSQRLLSKLQEVDALRAPRPRKASGAAAADVPSGPGSKRGAAAVDRLAAALEMDGIESLDTASLHAALGLPPPPKDTRDPHAAELSTSYHARPQVAAYVTARAAPTYAALTRVLRDLAALTPPPHPSLAADGARPGFSPKTVLDYGAKAGLGLWALNEVWPGATRSVLAVESSSAMSELGVRVETALKQLLVEEQEQLHAEEAEAQGGRRRIWGSRGRGADKRAPGPLVNWVRDLPSLKSAPQLKQKYDLVLCSYALSDLPDADSGREKLVRQLWEMTSDVLVIIEPGTPAGFHHVREARSQVLAREARKRTKALASADITAAGNADAKLDVHASAKLQATGAHVVAPCPHDKPCPMEGQRMWCHFGQRLERPAFVQQLLPGARGHQDELFSYVVLRRGPRNTQTPEVSIARDMAPDAALPSWALPEAVVRKQMMLNRMAAEASASPLRVQGAEAAGEEALGGGGQEEQQPGAAGAASARDLLSDEVAAHLARIEQGEVAAGEDEDELEEDERDNDDAVGGSGGLRAGQGAAGATGIDLAYQAGDAVEDALVAEQAEARRENRRGSRATLWAAAGRRSSKQAVSAPADEDAMLRLLRTLADADQPQQTEQAEQQRQQQQQQQHTAQPSLAAEKEESSPLHQQAATAAAAGPALGGPVAASFSSRFPAYGVGLVDRLMMMEEQGMAWQSSQAGLTMDVAQLASSLASAMRKPQHVVHAAVPGQETTSATGSQTGLSLLQGNAGWAGSEQVLQTPEQERELAVAQLKREVFGLEGDAADNDGGGRQAMADDFLNPTDGEHAAGDAHQYHAEQYEAQVLLAQHASTRWPRIYRPPRVRGGHVILDLCMPEAEAADGADSNPEASPSTTAQLERHVVTRSDAKGWMGRAAWELAHEVRWGDLWPGWYNNNRRRQPVLDPDSPEVQALRDAARRAKQEQEQAEVEAAMRHYGFDAPQDRRR